MVKISKKENKILSRRRKIAVRRWWGFLRFFLVGMFFLGALWGLNQLYNSSYFEIKSIEVEGNDYYQDSTIKEKLVDISGTNIFEVNRKKVEEKLVKDMLWLKEVKLSKVFPDKIIIRVVERNPYIKIAYKNKLYLVDDEGVVLDEIDKGELEKYKEIIIVNNAVNYYPEIGEKIAKKNALSCGKIYLILDSKLKNEIKEAKLSNNIYGDIVFLTFDNKEIIFGSSEEIVQKCEVLKQILKQLEKEEYKYDTIDLRVTENPTVK